MERPGPALCLRAPHASLVLQIAGLAIVILATGAHAAISNSEVAVALDASADIARVRVKIRLRNDGPSAERVVKVSSPGGTGSILVSLGDKLTKASRIPATRSAGEGVLYEVALATPLEAGDELALVVAYDLASAIVPSPPEIEEGGAHFVELDVPTFFSSPYATKSLTAVVKLANRPTGDVVSGPQPFKINGATVVFGPYSDVQPLWKEGVKLRFKNNRGMLVASEALREVYVSHWGNIAAKEEYHVENAAARHTGRWSRVDYAKGSHSPLASHTAIGDVWVYLPMRSSNVVYKDLVGNITTSRMRKPNGKNLPVQLSFRFPLLGGWKNHFWYTYDVPLSDLAQSRGLSHWVKVPVYPSINERFMCHRLSIRVLLPEGAKNVAVLPHPSLEFSVAKTLEKTTLNYFGRTVVTLSASDVYANAPEHDKHVYVSYDFAPICLLAAPLLVASGIFAVFVAFIVYAGADLRLVPEEHDPKARAAMLVTDQHLRIAAALRRMDASHAELDLIFTQLNNTSEAGAAMASRLSIESSLKEQEAEIQASSAALKQIGSESADLAAALCKRLSEKREFCMKAISSKHMLLENRMTEEKYMKQVDGVIALQLRAVSEELDALAEALLEHIVD
jgi:oligosaccharyltransferase complex subunit alpha (ribophorin I)